MPSTATSLDAVLVLMEARQSLVALEKVQIDRKELPPISFSLGALTTTSYDYILRNAVASLLICIDEMDLSGLYLNNIPNRFVHSPTGQYLSVTRDSAHLFIKWNPVINFPYSTSELH